jgi:hypothetical protein
LASVASRQDPFPDLTGVQECAVIAHRRPSLGQVSCKNTNTHALERAGRVRVPALLVACVGRADGQRTCMVSSAGAFTVSQTPVIRLRPSLVVLGSASTAVPAVALVQ